MYNVRGTERCWADGADGSINDLVQFVMGPSAEEGI
jgi:hypothetical protein